MAEFSFNPKLPDYIAPINKLNGRPSTSRINDLANTARQKTLTVAAEGAMCPILYGEVNVGGLLFALGFNGPNLVVGYIWGIGEVESIDTLYINDEDVPVGVTVTNYTGTTTQGVDPTLASAIPAYLDTLKVTLGGELRGLAYSVIEVPPNTIEGFPRVRATIKGRKVLDPRTGIVAFSDLPSLCMADLITDKFYGLGATAIGVEECADWNDELLGGLVPRARLSLVISRGRPAPDYLEILSEYAECWYTFEGEGVRMTPDRIVDLTQVPIVDPSTILKDSLSMSKSTLTNVPTEVEVRFTSKTGTSEPWKTESVIRSLPDVDTGVVARIPTTVSLEGIYREVEASNRALSKLNRLKDQVQVSWVSTDVGITRQIGDVVKIQHPIRGFDDIPVRIEKADLTSAGRYAISGKVYDATHYPSEIDPSLDGVVPEGVISMLSGDVIPVGWESYDAPNGRYIKIADDVEPIGTIGGASSVMLPSGQTSDNPSHSGETVGYYIDYFTGGSAVGYRFGSPDMSKAIHSHTYSGHVFEPSIKTKSHKLVIKTDGGSTKIPKDIITFGLEGILDGSATRVTTPEGRILKAEPVEKSFGDNIKNGSVMLDYADDRHIHRSLLGPFSNLTANPDFGRNPYNPPKSGGGNHTHDLNVTIETLLKKYPLAAYSGISDYSVKPGRMFLWAGDINNLPNDYVLVEEVKGYFLEFLGLDAKLPSGNNTVSIEGNSSVKSHNHTSSDSTTTYEVTPYSHTDYVDHSHSMNETISFQPEYYCLALIMYQPED